MHRIHHPLRAFNQLCQLLPLLHSAQPETCSPQAEAQERQSGMDSLFGGSALKAPDLPKVADWDPLEKLRYEFDAIGFGVTNLPRCGDL